MTRLREKSVSLTGFLERLMDALLPKVVHIVTPREAAQRGCQLSLRLALRKFEAKRCHERLTTAGVICDWREPDILRVAPAPLFNSYHDVFTAAEALARAVAA